MIDINGIKKTPIYQICALRRYLISAITRETSRLSYAAHSKDLKTLSRLLEMENRHLQCLWKKSYEA